MDDSRSDRIQRFAEIHKQARLDAKQSQEYMAMELSVSKKTVQNWEKGISSPTFFQSLEWFKALKINPFPAYQKLISPYKLYDIKPSDDEKKIDEALTEAIANLSPNEKRALLYILMGNHGSSSYSVIQLILAHMHLPIKERLFNAKSVLSKYELDKKMGNIICKNNILPDIENLKSAIEQAEKSTLVNEFGYNNVEK